MLAAMESSELRTELFDYTLPAELIASRPGQRRDGSRMLVIDRAEGTIAHRWFREFPEYVGEGDLCLFNDTRVVPARCFSDDGAIELLRLEEIEERVWKCLVKPGRRMKPGKELMVAGVRGVVEAVVGEGARVIRWDGDIDLDKHGHMPLPPYIGREDAEIDRERYQTVYARESGAVAAPTAGLHFTSELVGKLPHAFLTLHVGSGTFRPVKVELVSAHEMHTERFHINAETVAAIALARRVLAVGTTVVRVLEHLTRGGRALEAGHGETDIFIYPPYSFQRTGAMLTNFHLPKSTLLMLVCAFAGRDLMMEAYARAVEERYRFYSYGDCMLII